MQKLFKIVGITLAVLFGLVVLAFIGLKLISDEQYKEWLTEGAKSVTGRDLQVDSLELDFTSSVLIKAGGVRLANADWGTRPDMASIGRLEAELALFPLLSGTAEFRTIVEDANVVAETSPDGVGNWVFGGPAEEETDVEAPEEAADGGLPIKPLVQELRIENFTLTYRDGASDTEKSAAVSRLTVLPEGETSALDLSASFDQKPITMSGNLGDLSGVLVGESSSIDLQGRLDDNAVSVAGDWGPLLPQANAQLKLGVEVPSSSRLAQLADVDLAEIGGLDLSALLKIQDGHFAISDLGSNLNGDHLNASIEGEIGDLLDFDEVALNAKASTKTLAKLAELFKVELPVPLPPEATVSAKVSGNLDQLAVQDIAIQVLDAGIKVSVSGIVHNALKPEGVDADFTVHVDSLASLSKFANMELPDQGTIDVSGKVKSVQKTYSLENLKAQLNGEGFEAQLSGAIADLLAVSGINAEINADLVSLSALSTIANTELPQTDPINIAGKLKYGTDQQSQTTADISVTSGAARVNVNGNLDDLKAPNALQASVEVSADTLDDFSKFAQMTLPKKGPFNLNGTIRTGDNEYHLEDFRMTLEDQEVNGGVGVVVAADESAHTSIDGRLHIPYLDLSSWLALATEQPEAAEATTLGETSTEEASIEEIATDSEKFLFSREPFAIDALNTINADLALTADRFVFKNSDLREVSIRLLLNDGVLSVDPLYAVDVNTGGKLQGDIEVAAKSLPLTLGFGISLVDLSMPNLGGTLDLNIDLDGDGSSMAELMGGLDGQILLLAKDGRIEKSFLTSFGTGFLSGLNPFAADETYTELECAILRVDITDGLADFERKLAMQMTKTTWRGGGDINLKTEKLDVGVVPKPRTGLGLSAGSLASLVHVGGTLKNPSVKLDPKDVALKYGKYMAALSTGGLSILAEGLLNKKQANVDVCQQILDGTVFDEEAQSEEAAAEEDPANATEATPADSSAESGSQAADAPQEPEQAEQATVDQPTEDKKPDLVPKNLQ